MPEITEESQKRIEEFITAYGKIVEEYKCDFVSFPQFVPDGAGAFKVVIHQQPVDTTNMPQKSPFEAK